MFAFDLESPANFSRVIGFRSVDRGFLEICDCRFFHHFSQNGGVFSLVDIAGPRKVNCAPAERWEN